MIVAIDGPAGVGKSTVAHKVGDEENLVFLNSGSFYRAITLGLLDAGIDISDADAVVEFAKKQDLNYVNSHLILNGKDVDDQLHSDRVDANVSQVSAIVPVRHLVNDRMRQIVSKLNIICEGRDMTTVVFPNAEHKFFLTASVDVQAKRRFDQGCSNKTLEEIKQDIIRRDEMDKNKAEGSLKIAPDATVIDTSHLTIDEVCAIIKGKIHNKGFNMDKKEVEMNAVQGSTNIHTQLEESLKNMGQVEDGRNVEGTVVQVTSEYVFIDVGCKSEGKIPVAEFNGEMPKIGSTVTVFLINQFGKYGPEISKNRADEKKYRHELKEAFDNKTPVPKSYRSCFA